MRASIYRKEHFNAAHRLLNQDWDDAKNLDVFGKCFSPNYHGHNYELTVKVTAEVNPETGYVIDTKVLSEWIKELILIPFDHKNLNLDVAYFKNINPTAENIAKVIYDLLRERIDSSKELKVILYETERNYVEYPA